MRGLHWFRNDLRLEDNRVLSDLFQAVDEWCGLFILEPRLVDIPSVSQKRLSFLFECLDDLSDELDQDGNRLVIVEGPAETQIPGLCINCPHRCSLLTKAQHRLQGPGINQ